MDEPSRRGFLTGAGQFIAGMMALQVLPGLSVPTQAEGSTVLWTPSQKIVQATSVRQVRSILQVIVKEVGSDRDLLRQEITFEAANTYEVNFHDSLEMLTTGDGYYLHDIALTTSLKHVEGLPSLTRTVSTLGLLSDQR